MTFFMTIIYIIIHRHTYDTFKKGFIFKYLACFPSLSSVVGERMVTKRGAEPESFIRSSSLDSCGWNRGFLLFFFVLGLTS